MTTRYDVSRDPLQGGYVATQCPVRAQNDALVPAEPVPASPLLERRFARGRQFEDEVFARLLELNPDALLIEGEDTAAREQATIDAMNAGVPLILGGRLPADPIGRRVGKPDLLVACGAGGYRAVDVKHHMALVIAEDGAQGLPGFCSSFEQPALEDAAEDPAVRARR